MCVFFSVLLSPLLPRILLDFLLGGCKAPSIAYSCYLYRKRVFFSHKEQSRMYFCWLGVATWFGCFISPEHHPSTYIQMSNGCKLFGCKFVVDRILSTFTKVHKLQQYQAALLFYIASAIRHGDI